MNDLIFQVNYSRIKYPEIPMNTLKDILLYYFLKHNLTQDLLTISISQYIENMWLFHRDEVSLIINQAKEKEFTNIQKFDNPILRSYFNNFVSKMIVEYDIPDVVMRNFILTTGFKKQFAQIGIYEAIITWLFMTTLQEKLDEIKNATKSMQTLYINDTEHDYVFVYTVLYVD